MRKINWLQVISIVIPILIGVVAGWYTMQGRIISLEERIKAQTDLKSDIKDVNDRINKLADAEDKKHGDMWRAISQKKDK